MIKIENFEVLGMDHAIRGMRNPMNSWEKSDSFECSDRKCTENCPMYSEDDCECTSTESGIIIGPEDHNLMMKLRNAGTDHRKYLRMITVYLDITAPLYWWKEFDTYKVGTVANSCSTMHKIHEKEFTLEDFSCEHLFRDNCLRVHNNGDWRDINNAQWLLFTIDILNEHRKLYLQAKEGSVDVGDPKDHWWQMIQLLPSSYNQKRTIMLNYEVLANIYKSRRNHKLDEWREFCKWIESLPYSELITGSDGKEEEE